MALLFCQTLSPTIGFKLNRQPDTKPISLTGIGKQSMSWQDDADRSSQELDCFP